MSTATKTRVKAPAKSTSKSAPGDAIDMLMSDHKAVKALFKQYDALVKADGNAEEKQAIAQQICQMLTVHASVEEELFYPASRGVLGADADLVDEADVEHSTAKDLIAQIEDSSADDELYDAKVKVLGEYIDHHVKEEEGEMFPKVKKSKLDTQSLGADMAVRKEELMAEATAEA